MIRFGVTLTVLSTLLWWVFQNANLGVGSYSLGINELAVPVTSAILASVGFPWKRKLAYASVTMGLYLLSGMTAEMVGLHALVREQLTTGDTFPSLLSILYMAWLTTFPFVMLVLFVGRRPSLLWSRRAG